MPPRTPSRDSPQDGVHQRYQPARPRQGYPHRGAAPGGHQQEGQGQGLHQGHLHQPQHRAAHPAYWSRKVSERGQLLPGLPAPTVHPHGHRGVGLVEADRVAGPGQVAGQGHVLAAGRPVSPRSHRRRASTSRRTRKHCPLACTSATAPRRPARDAPGGRPGWSAGPGGPGPRPAPETSWAVATLSTARPSPASVGDEGLAPGRRPGGRPRRWSGARRAAGRCCCKSHLQPPGLPVPVRRDRAGVHQAHPSDPGPGSPAPGPRVPSTEPPSTTTTSATSGPWRSRPSRHGPRRPASSRTGTMTLIRSPLPGGCRPAPPKGPLTGQPGHACPAGGAPETGQDAPAGQDLGPGQGHPGHSCPPHKTSALGLRTRGACLSISPWVHRGVPAGRDGLWGG